jgi:DNA/RNA-binding domain of Phe-tRNA-synthetase-like protein
MRERIDMLVFGAVPEFVRLSVRVTGVDQAVHAGAIRAFLRGVSGAPRGPGFDSALAAWRRAYAAVGLPADTVPPQEALARWAASPGGVPTQGAILDLANALSLQRGAPAAAYDLGAAANGLWLRPSRGIEWHKDLSGAAENPAVGELILADGADVVLARHWHGTPGRTALPGDACRTALFHVDFLGRPTDLDAQVATVLRLLGAYLGGTAAAAVLERGRPQTDWPAD